MSEDTLGKLKKLLDRRCFVQDTFTLQEQVQDHRFGEICMWSQNQGQGLGISKSHAAQSAEECLELVSMAKERFEYNYDYLMKMLDYSVEVKGLELFEVTSYYEAPVRDLKQEIQMRKENNQ